MNVTGGDRAGEDVICALWVSIPSVVSRGWNKQLMGEKKMTHSIGKENIQNVKHSDVFTHFSVIQIFRLRPRPARCSSNPLKPKRNGMTQSPTKYVTQIRKRRGGGKKECAPVSVCALHFKLSNLNAV